MRILIVDGFSNHNWQTTTRLIKQILLQNDSFTVDISTSPASEQSDGWDNWRPEFHTYDVVVQTCNDSGGGPSWPLNVQRDLEAFVSAGGGLYILHSANNAFPEWDAYNRMIGLGWRNQGYGYAITIDSSGAMIKHPPGKGGATSHGERVDALLTRIGDHPIHADLPRQWMAADLEIYRYARGPAENLTVLSYASEPKTKLNFPIEWVVTYGTGRVYNSTFGHIWKGDSNPNGARCIAFQTLLVRAIQWLGASDVTWPVPEDFPTANSIKLQPKQ